MIIEELTVTAFQQHTRIVGCEKTKLAICIDPGDGSDEIVQAIDRHGFELQAIACTHAHMDHVGGVAALKKLKRADQHWSDGQIYLVGELSFRVIHCPGHTPGHVVLFEPNERKVFVGDCLFAGSIGRTDLPGGSTEQLMDSLFNKILPLGDDVEVYSGHGPRTTIGQERRTNPFLTGAYNIGGSGRF